MKTLLTLLLTSSLSLFASPYWVQVSSIEGSKNISASFLSKVKQSGFSHDIIDGDSRKRVCLGPFKSKKTAMDALPKIRCKVAHDAFVVGDFTEKKTKSIVQQKVAKDLSKSGAVALKPLPKAVLKPCLCIYDAHMLHKMELDKAVAYYKKSSYYSFEK